MATRTTSWTCSCATAQPARRAIVSVSSGGGQANSASVHPSISADGRYVAFASDAGDLVAGDLDGVYDAFVHDRQSDRTHSASWF